MRVVLSLCLLASTCTAQEMEQYVFGFLRAYPDRKELPEAEAMAIQKAHIAHLDKMAADGYLVGAGPLISSPDLRGIVIFRGISIEKAREMAAQDPAVINKRLRVHVDNWRAVKGIGDALAEQMKQPGHKFRMTRYGFLVSWRTSQWPADETSESAKATRAEHTRWLRGNADKVAAFGSLPGSKEFAGVAVFRSTDLEEIRKLVAEDPFVRAGWTRPEVLTWMVAEGVIP